MRGGIRVRAAKDGTARYQAHYANPHPDPTKSYNQEIVKTFERRKDARAWLTEQLADVQRGTYIDPRRGDRLLADLAADWEDTWLDLEPKTEARYQQILRTHLLPAFGTWRVATITHEDVQKFVARLARERDEDGNPVRAHGTVVKVKVVFSALMAYAVRHGNVAANPVTGVRMPKPPFRERPVFLSHHEVRALAEQIDPHFRVLLYVAAYSGARAGELHALRVRDVNEDGRLLHLTRALKSVDGPAPAFGRPKNGKPRVVRLPARVAAMLTAHLSSLPGGAHPDALVFVGPEGAVMRQSNFMRRHFRPAVRRALPAEKRGLRFHDLRHTAASLLAQLGGTPQQVADHIGDSVKVTWETYAHLFEGHDDDLMRLMDAGIADAAAGPQTPVLRAIEGSA